MYAKVGARKIYFMNVNDLLRFVQVIIDMYNKTLKPDQVQARAITYAASYPDYMLDPTGTDKEPDGGDGRPIRPSRIVTYSIPRRENGTLGTAPFSTPKEVRPRGRETINVPGDTTDERGRVVTVYNKWFDNLVRFDCFAETAEDSLDLCMEFERLMEIHAETFEHLGINRFIYQGRTSPNFSLRTELHGQACTYYVRDVMSFTREEDPITQIDIETYVKHLSVLDEGVYGFQDPSVTEVLRTTINAGNSQS